MGVEIALDLRDCHSFCQNIVVARWTPPVSIVAEGRLPALVNIARKGDLFNSP
jgi:hypothetical protein